mgnify:CR=1 FL=1
MKKLVTVGIVICFLLFAVGCDEKKTIQSIRVGQTTAKSLAMATYTAVTLMHSTGKITDAQWARFEAVYERYTTADTLLTDSLKAWDSGIGKPTVERIQLLLENLNTIVGDINALIDAWKVECVKAGGVVIEKLPVVGVMARK